MPALAIVTESYFDGQRLHAEGPFTLEIVNGRIAEIHQCDLTRISKANLPREIHRACFAMPGLVEAHCHLFLDGAQLDFNKRKRYLGASFEEMLGTGWRSLDENLAAGITLIRDAGDLRGINTHIKSELKCRDGLRPELRSPGRAIRKQGRYGGFMAVEVTDSESLICTIREHAATADDLKILLTGIIDFETGEVKGPLQFDAGETKIIVKTAREVGKLTYAHCSGVDGLKIAVEAGIDSIEHGFFMTRDILRVMADKGIAWVPTFSPVYFQFARPELAGWSGETVRKLDSILQNHFEHVALAYEMGVRVIPGSDAGSYGVPHGRGLIDEIVFHHRSGVDLEKILASATSLARRVWNCESADLKPGNVANLILLDQSPFETLDALQKIKGVVKGSSWRIGLPSIDFDQS